MRAFILLLIFACAMPCVGLTQTAATASDAPTAKSVAALLQQQCTMRQGAQYDAYLATLAPNFQIIGPGIVKLTRGQLAASFAKGQRNDTALQKCDINIVFASKTSDGAYAQYTQTDTYPDQTVTVYDDAYFATAESGLIVRDVHRYARNVYAGTKLIFGMGKQEFPATAQLRATPPPPPMPAKDAEAASGITISKCDYTESNGGHNVWHPFAGTEEGVGSNMPRVDVKFKNTFAQTVSQVVFNVLIDGESLGVVKANGKYATDVPVALRLVLGTDRPIAQDKAICYVTSVNRLDGTTWTNPNPPPSPAPSPSP